MMEENFLLNFDRVISDSSIPAIIRFTFLQIRNRKNSYMTPGEFLRDLSDVDLQNLIDLADILYGKDNQESEFTVNRATNHLIILTLGLATAEGSMDINDATILSSLKMTITFITLESLFRQGLIELDRDKLSYVDDAECVARLKQIRES